MKRLIAASVILLAGCASQPADVAPAAAPDTRAAEMQVTMTELLEQLDVLNARVAKLEANAPAAAETRKSEPAQVVEPPPSPMVVAAQSRAPQEQQRPATVPPRPASASLAAAQVAEAYRSAIVLFGKGRLAEARAGFQKVFDTEPTGELADNALFWIGETYFTAGKFNEAMSFYKRVTTEFADQNKAPDAMYKIALGYEKTGDLALARQTLQELMKVYPYSSSADSAKRELERIKY